MNTRKINNTQASTAVTKTAAGVSPGADNTNGELQLEATSASGVTPNSSACSSVQRRMCSPGEWSLTEDVNYALHRLGITMETADPAGPDGEHLRTELRQMVIGEVIKAEKHLHGILVEVICLLLRRRGRQPGPGLEYLPTDALFFVFSDLYDAVARSAGLRQPRDQAYEDIPWMYGHWVEVLTDAGSGRGKMWFRDCLSVASDLGYASAALARLRDWLSTKGGVVSA